MAITIKELLAADTISQAANKINFNFDQLLLNGGGPVGPPGPDGPPGPIGGRGIRGSQWFDGPLEPIDPSITFPTLHQHDMYLEGPISSFQTGDGDVWEYNGTTWIWTGINLKGDQGDPGVSEDWGTFGGALVIGGEENLYPVQEASLPTEVRSVSIGGVPDGIWVGAASNYEIDTNLAKDMNSSRSSLWIHTADTSVSAIKFSGGMGVVGDFSNVYGQLSSIGLAEGDSLVIEDYRDTGNAANSQGVRLKSRNRDIGIQASRGFSLTTGNNFGLPGSAYTTQADISLTILANAGITTQAEIVLQNQIVSESAIFKVGTQETNSGSGAFQGNIHARSYSNYTEAEAQISLKSYNAAATSIHIYSPAGGIIETAGTTLQLNGQDVVVNAVNTGGTISLTGKERVLISSQKENVEIFAPKGKLLVETGSNGTGIPGEGNVEFDIRWNGAMYIYDSVGVQPNVGIGFDPTNPLNNNLCVNDRVAIGDSSDSTIITKSNSLWVQERFAIGDCLPEGYATGNIIPNNTSDRMGLRISMDGKYTAGSSTFSLITYNNESQDNNPLSKNGIYAYVTDNINVPLSTGKRIGLAANVSHYGKVDNFGCQVQMLQNFLNAVGTDYCFHGKGRTWAVYGDQYGLDIDLGFATGAPTPATSSSQFVGTKIVIESNGSGRTYGHIVDITGGSYQKGINVQLTGGGSNTKEGIFVQDNTLDPDIVMKNYISGRTVLGTTNLTSTSSATVLIRGDQQYDHVHGDKSYALRVERLDDGTGIQQDLTGGIYIDYTNGLDSRFTHPLKIVGTAPTVANPFTPIPSNAPLTTSFFDVRGDGSIWMGGDCPGISGGIGPSYKSRVMVKCRTSWFRLERSNVGSQTFLTSISDERYKKNVNSLSGSLNEITQLNPVSFEWNEDYKDLQVKKSGIIEEGDSETVQEMRAYHNGTQVGFIAQDVQKVFPGAVKEEEEEGLSIKYPELTAHLVKAMQEQQKTIEDLEARLQQLEEKS